MSSTHNNYQHVHRRKTIAHKIGIHLALVLTIGKRRITKITEIKGSNQRLDGEAAGWLSVAWVSVNKRIWTLMLSAIFNLYPSSIKIHPFHCSPVNLVRPIVRIATKAKQYYQVELELFSFQAPQNEAHACKQIFLCTLKWLFQIFSQQFEFF